MANIVTVRQFNHAYRLAKPGTQFVVVDGCRRKILAAVTVNEVPELIEKTIKVVFSK